MAENKVQFNLKNVHYATFTESSGTYTYATPVAIPGAVNLSLDVQGNGEKFYADGIVYFYDGASSGYEGDLEVAKIPEAMLADIYGTTLEATDKVLIENEADACKPFALLFEIDGDVNHTLHVLYNCSATRPSIASATNEGSRSPQTQSVTISAMPRVDGLIHTQTTGDTTATIVSGWFSSVYEP